ncbi:DNA-binding response OmpR family regulator [Nakamurella sp. UYEF19]|uniref:response regulator n=1 Tax=Nakamurella sp. UYEF19 TaxID=1756392 RepID=UPI003399B5FF
MSTVNGSVGDDMEVPGPVVVIADDDPDIRRLVEVAVTRAGAVVGANVADGAEAWKAISRLHPAMAILDVSMPEKTGLEVCRLVRADTSLTEIKLILLSAAVHPEAIAAGRAAGADLYSQKPFRLRILQDEIRGLLSIGVTTS